MLRKLLFAAVVAVAAGTAAIMPLPATAQVYAQVAPPPLRYEPVPAPRRGYVWVPGYWDWRYHRHVWVPGTWVSARRGYRYVSPTWHHRDGRWYFDRGGWNRGDRDGDGVANRYDRSPNNPFRR